MSYTLSPKAKADILSIAKHIADDNPHAALNWYEDILAVCRVLGDLPAVGQSRDDVEAGLRTFPKGNYMIIFRAHGPDAVILRVVHGARDWPKLAR